MRLFVQVRPSPGAVAHLQAHLGRVRTSNPDQWHVTLAFLGDVADAEPLHGGLQAAADLHPPFALRLAGGGTFGPRTTWAGVAGDVEVLRSLAQHVQDACGLEPRPYRPHLTVGRVDPRLLSGYDGPEFRVDQLQLVQSVLGTRAVHTVLRAYPLYQA
ncbi:MAG: RNA 2',3'-cyclic phosphodiesterase [Actinobacteria bacterium]|nr:RNA 2',3'-cyclic phosphodiesterase [Actinomycetota bacterium]MCA1721242.1 RNA 2',3'-cyclic phosphodiesterase [Actinomycetota bacterium]